MKVESIWSYSFLNLLSICPNARLVPYANLDCTVENEDPEDEFHSPLIYMMFLATSMNQISGINACVGEQDVKANSISTNADTCEQCNNLRIDHVPPGVPPTLNGMAADFEASVERGCKICKIVLETIRPYDQETILKGYIKPGAALDLLVKSRGGRVNRYEVFTQVGRQPSPWPGIGQARIIAQTSSDPKLTDLIASWVAECKGHQSCQLPNPPSFPTRILNIDGDQIRLEVPDQDERGAEPYVALSHCWGKRQLPTTTASTIDGYKSVVPWDILSQTFRDAITLSRALGYRYIWIDSLCIVQDSDSDWRSEASKMASVYSDAELVISAARSKDGTGGLFAKRSPPYIVTEKARPVDLGHKVFTDSTSNGELVEYYARDAVRHAQWDAMEMVSSNCDHLNPLLQRAWAFQERILATRIIHFAEHELIFECRQRQCCECMYLDRPESRPRMERNINNIKLDFAALLNSPDPRNPISDPYILWSRIIEEYTSRKLTYEKDRLPALEGASIQLRRLDVGRYVAGMFIKDMPRCLLWYVGEPCVKNIDVAPSWSWVSCQSPLKRPPHVKFHWNRYLALTDDYPDGVQEVCADIVDLIETQESEHAAASQTSKPSYVILLYGPLISAAIVIDRYFKPKLTSGPSMDKGGVRQADFEYHLVREGQKQKFLFDCFLHVGPTKMESGSKVLLLAVAITGGGRMPNSGLVLRQFGVTESGAHICMRIGMFDNLSGETNGWFDGAEMASVLIL
ncbi:HET-domain-containing protein [Lepidopterella palustris CBS 459.81]|uniref:HET-domain-containing protein n=1 Tax=Lepidopterella palustris CBS 459.81 TaxID=1314670 RepID=A0A8E2JEU8_9PEZI|nr:HET-domain-containing protein [Lepidopterella palustris CBS 459.81]